MVTLVNRAKVSTSTTGTGTITLGAAADGYQTFAAAGVTDGQTVRYVIEDAGGWEIGSGVFDATAGTMTRVVSESSNSDTALNLSGSATVFVSATADDFLAWYYSRLVSVDTTLPENAEVIAGSETAIADGVTLTIPSTSRLELRAFASGQAL